MRAKGHDVSKVHIDGSVIPTRIIMIIIIMCMYREIQGLWENVQTSLGKGYIEVHCTFLATLNLVLSPKKEYFGKGSFRSFLSHRSKKLRAGCFQIYLDFFFLCSKL